jgi:glycosyltransferase involved in cell wall biosynthesis
MKLSVLMITYNHEHYIRQALDSVLAQDVDFDYEIVVGEDCSTDSTRQILQEYERNHPAKFRLLLREKNMGAIRNFFSVLEACRGQYVALLEGDDYWTCNLKLKRQVEFLDQHPDYAVCFHNVIGRYEESTRPDFTYVRASQPESFGLEELLNENVIPTCSAVFRRGLFGAVPQWALGLKMADYPLHILNAQYGKIGYLPENMGIYRVHGGGAWTALNWMTRAHSSIALFQQLSKNLEPRFRPAARRALAQRYWHLAFEYELQRDPRQALRYALRSLCTSARTNTPSLRYKLRVLARLSTPSFYRGAAWLYRGARGSNNGSPIHARPAPEKPRVSVIIPAWNAQRYLAEAVESILAQTFEDFECIVVDDGSLDRTAHVIADFARRDGRVRCVQIPHGGIVEALNAGLHAARGELIARMDADDICLPERFAKQIDFLDLHPQCVAVGSKVTLVDPYGSPLWDIEVKTEHEQIESELLGGNGWALFHPTAIIRKSAMSQIGGYRAEYQWSEDIDIFLRLAEVGRLANIPEALLRYRQHFSSVNRTKLELQLRRNQRLLAEAHERRGRSLPPGFVPPAPPQLEPDEQVRAWARRAIINRNYRVARRHAIALLRAAPLRYDNWSLMYHALAKR